MGQAILFYQVPVQPRVRLKHPRLLLLQACFRIRSSVNTFLGAKWVVPTLVGLQFIMENAIQLDDLIQGYPHFRIPYVYSF